MYSIVSNLYVSCGGSITSVGEERAKLSFTCNYVVSVRRGFLFIWVLGLGCVILLWHSLSLPYNQFTLLEVFSYKVTILLLSIAKQNPYHSIMQTCPYNVNTLTPHLYIVKLGVYRGIRCFFLLIFALKHRLWVLARTASRVPTINVLSKNKKKITIFHPKIIVFYSCEKLQYITWACFRNTSLIIRKPDFVFF